MLGFSIGAMAILLAFSESKIFRLLSQKGNPKSGYIDLSSKFVHFILVQVAAIFFGVFLRAYGGKILACLAVFWMNYALLTGVATALALFGMAQIYNTLARFEPLEPTKQVQDKD